MQSAKKTSYDIFAWLPTDAQQDKIWYKTLLYRSSLMTSIRSVGTRGRGATAPTHPPGKPMIYITHVFTKKFAVHLNISCARVCVCMMILENERLHFSEKALLESIIIP